MIRVENVWFQNGDVVLYFSSSKTHQYPMSQAITIKPHPNNCPVCLLRDYLKVRPVVTGPLYLTSEGIPVQYQTVLKLLQTLSEFLDLPVDRYKPHSLRIGATTELHVQGYSNKVIQERGIFIKSFSDVYKTLLTLQKSRRYGYWVTPICIS